MIDFRIGDEVFVIPDKDFYKTAHIQKEYGIPNIYDRGIIESVENNTYNYNGANKSGDFTGNIYWVVFSSHVKIWFAKHELVLSGFDD